MVCLYPSASLLSVLRYGQGCHFFAQIWSTQIWRVPPGCHKFAQIQLSSDMVQIFFIVQIWFRYGFQICQVQIFFRYGFQICKVQIWFQKQFSDMLGSDIFHSSDIFQIWFQIWFSDMMGLSEARPETLDLWTFLHSSHAQF